MWRSPFVKVNAARRGEKDGGAVKLTCSDSTTALRPFLGMKGVSLVAKKLASVLCVLGASYVFESLLTRASDV